jgi:hypothetical protein
MALADLAAKTKPTLDLTGDVSITGTAHFAPTATS